MNAALISEIKEQARRYDDLLRAKNRLLLQMQSLCKRQVSHDDDVLVLQSDPDKKYKLVTKKGRELFQAWKTKDALHPHFPAISVILDPYNQAIAPFKEPIKHTVSVLESSAKRLPIWAWTEKIKGVGPLSFAQIIGAAGDLSRYPSPKYLHKRMGLGVIYGERQRKCLDKNLALVHGYNPQRRALMFIVGENLIRKRSPTYYDLYLARKDKEFQKNPTASKMVIHRRAKRYMEKALLRDMWVEWNITVAALKAA